jgi:hypothetical protein
VQDGCFPPLTLVHRFITPPHVSTVANQSRITILTRCVTTASSCHRSPPRLIWVEGGVGTGADRAAIRPMKKMRHAQLVRCSRMAQRLTGAGSKWPQLNYSRGRRDAQEQIEHIDLIHRLANATLVVVTTEDANSYLPSVQEPQSTQGYPLRINGC